MFTGLIKNTAAIESIQPRGQDLKEFGLALSLCWPDSELPQIGDSIAVDGCCLTVIRASFIDSGIISVSFDVSPETISRTRFALLSVGDACNVEPALRMGDPLGGHWVTGHVDDLSTLTSVEKQGDFFELRFKVKKEFQKLLIPKGSVAINGISLTVNEVCDEDLSFSVMIIPETWKKTTLSLNQVGSKVHIEFDVLGKYIQRFITKYTEANQVCD